MDISLMNSVGAAHMEEAERRFQLAAGEAVQQDFDSVFQSALNMVNETNDLHNQAESAQIQFALGESENTHDLLIAQEKANVALQYTVAVKDKIIDAYREIMQMQI